jgi:hypothetical protein
MITGDEYVSVGQGISVKRKTIIDVNSNVIRLPGGMKGTKEYSIGNKFESIGVVVKRYNSDGVDYCHIIWGNGQVRPTTEYMTDLLAEDDFKGCGYVIPQPKLRVDQVMYVRPGVRTPSEEYPAVGSTYETDVKIIEVLSSQFGASILYRVYSPQYGYLKLHQDHLITPSERLNYLYKDFKQFSMEEDCSPFFKKGEIVYLFDGFISNKKESVMVKMNDDLQKLLKTI